MPSIQNITLADNVPTNHVFVPVASSNGSVTLVNRTGKSISASAESLVLTYSPASAKRKTYRNNFRLNVPFEATIDGVVQVRDVFRMSTDMVIPELMTATERLMVATLAGAALTNAIIKGYTSDLAPMIGS